MQRLNVVVNDYPNSVSYGGMFQTTVGDTIHLPPNSKVVLDSFYTDIQGSANNFTVPAQTLALSSDYPALDVKEIILASNTYAIASDLVDAVTLAFNNTLNSSPFNNSRPNDVGVCISGSLVGDNYSTSFSTFFKKPADDYNEQDMSIDVNGYLVPSAIGEFSVIMDNPIINGGFQVSHGFKLGSIVDTNEFKIGLMRDIDGGGVDCGLELQLNGKLYLYNYVAYGSVERTEIVGTLSTLFPDGCVLYWYVVEGDLRLTVRNSAGNATLYESPANTFSSFDFVGPWHYTLSGEYAGGNKVGINFETTGGQPVEKHYRDISTVVSTVSRNVYWDFSQSSVIATILAVPKTILRTGTVGTYTSTSPVNTSGVGEFLSLALECSDFSVKNYQGLPIRAGNTGTGKTNAIAYFNPKKVAPTSTVYGYDNTGKEPMPLNNETALQIRSLNFRLINILTGLEFKCVNCVFELSLGLL